MPTWNKELHALTKSDVERLSLEFLMGWQDFIASGHTFRLQGFNHMREKYGFEPLTKDMSFAYRIDYIKSHYTDEQIESGIRDYLMTARVGDTRWTGIELFDCRFGPEYAKAFKILLGSAKYRKISEEFRNMKSMATQMAVYGGMGLAGEATKCKAQRTNILRYGGANPMDSDVVRANLARMNCAKYGGVSPFSDSKVRSKDMRKKRPDLFAAMAEYKRNGFASDISCESTAEFIAFKLLVSRFGMADIYCQYGLHPYDARYPYNCDFYIKSLDLFIELHFYYTHGWHWFDASNHDDVLRVKHLLNTGRAQNLNAVKVWTDLDLKKRAQAASSGIKYLVFWGERHGNPVDSLWDFDKWFFDYDCDYDAFVRDFPCNSY